MKKVILAVVFCAFLPFIHGCSTPQAAVEATAQPIPEHTTTQQTPPPDDVADAEKESQLITPSKEDVLDARERAFAGMTSSDVKKLSDIVKSANLWWEHKYFYINIFGDLSNTDSLYWNYFDQTGEIQIGWAYDGNLDMQAICAEERLTEAEFYEKYATGVVTENVCDAETFVTLLRSVEVSVQNEDLKNALEYIMSETQLAKETHDVEHANNLYKALHDMDYFLLRYGPEDVGVYMQDKSTVSKYYDTLSFYS